MIALLGDSGNATAPDLHFHVMSSPSPLKSNGLPFMFTSFRGLGTVNTGTELLFGGQAQINNGALAGPHRDQLPLNNEEIDFGTD